MTPKSTRQLFQMRQTRDKAHHVLVRAANIQMIRNMPETDAALTKRPERKGGFVVEDNMRAPFTLQDYVKVGADFRPGMNRPAGHGFIQEMQSPIKHITDHMSPRSWELLRLLVLGGL
ncbi:unnamed protein product [Cylindrotheca closterium]|uniref:Uncharacterized protein n=1 Tax=Cylindrotheca closterium TaxID=2856 RepID=A0AAD2GAI1_9STRA|nr:unnamed protein product [Cylindrotheca closterium]